MCACQECATARKILALALVRGDAVAVALVELLLAICPDRMLAAHRARAIDTSEGYTDEWHNDPSLN